MKTSTNSITRDRQLAAAVGAAIVFDALAVGAPGLALAAVPFVVAAWRYRGRHVASALGLTLWCALWVLIGIAYALSNGSDSPEEANKATETISIGDAVGIYVGAPLAARLAMRLVFGRVVHRAAA